MKSKIKVKWVVNLPGEAEILIKKGELVNEGHLLAKVLIKKVESFDYSLNLRGLTSEKIEQLNQNFLKTKIEKGQLMCLIGSVFAKKVCFPVDGDFLGIDEFSNLKIEVVGDKEKDILSPMRAVVSKIEDGKMVLDFEAKEIKGIGLIEGKAWGRSNFVLVNDLKQLNSEFKGKIIFTSNLDKSFLLKAEVVGVVGVITNLEKSSDEIESQLPILSIKEDDWKNLLSRSGDEVNQKVLINSRLGRLLLVVE